MDMKTRTALVREHLEAKQARSPRRRRRTAGISSARATNDAIDGFDGGYRQPFTRSEAGDLSRDADARINRRIARGRRGVAARGTRLTRLTSVANPDRPTWARRDTVGPTPSPNRQTRARILRRVPKDAEARPSYIHHGLTQEQILAREPRIRRAQSRKRRIERRFAGTAH